MSKRTVPKGTEARSLRVLVVGAGFGGVAVAIELLKNGYRDVTVLESAPELGGTWHYNDYPGAACDVPSRVSTRSRSSSGRTGPDSARPRDEIIAYLRATSADYGVTPRVVTSTAVNSCSWNESTCEWTIQASGPDGPIDYTADALVLATGQLNKPAVPHIDGLDRFEGHVVPQRPLEP